MNVLDVLLSYVLLYKYLAIAVVVYFSAVILPLPSNAMLLAVGAFASQGYLNFWAALAIAAASNTAGDLTDYGIARKLGERATRALRLHKLKFYYHLQEELRTDAAITVFMTRFAGSLSTISNFIAGLVSVPLRTFFAMDLLGNTIEPFGALAIGYTVGDYWNNFSDLLELIAATIAIAVIVFVLIRIHRRITGRYG